jgi:hypothetical protein
MRATVLEQAIPTIEGYWYLATPYSKWSHGQEDANIVAQKLAAALLSIGVKVYSPIAHTHGIAPYLIGVDKRDHDFWLAADKPLLDAAGGLLIADLTGWRDSKGVTLEIQWAKEQKKPYWLLNPRTLAVRSVRL